MTWFHYYAETKQGSVSVADVVEQLRIIAKILEDSKVKAATFTLSIDEGEVKP